MWNPESEEVLFSEQKYIPTAESSCPSAEHDNLEYYLYNFKDKNIKKVGSQSYQIGQWYPQIKSYFEKKRLDIEKDLSKPLYFTGSIGSVRYLGSIDN